MAEPFVVVRIGAFLAWELEPHTLIRMRSGVKVVAEQLTTHITQFPLAMWLAVSPFECYIAWVGIKKSVISVHLLTGSEPKSVVHPIGPFWCCTKQVREVQRLVRSCFSADQQTTLCMVVKRHLTLILVELQNGVSVTFHDVSRFPRFPRYRQSKCCSLYVRKAYLMKPKQQRQYFTQVSEIYHSIRTGYKRVTSLPVCPTQPETSVFGTYLWPWWIMRINTKTLAMYEILPVEPWNCTDHLQHSSPDIRFQNRYLSTNFTVRWA